MYTYYSLENDLATANVTILGQYTKRLPNIYIFNYIVTENKSKSTSLDRIPISQKSQDVPS